MMRPIILALMVVGLLVPGPARADDAPLYEPGHHFGLGARLTAGGTWQVATTDPNADDSYNDSYNRTATGVMGTDAGLTGSWEYLFESGLAFGVALAVQFRSAGSFLPYEEVATEVQIDPRLRYYFNRGGHVRPYLQLALGPSFGQATDPLKEQTGGTVRTDTGSGYVETEYYGVRYALALNTSGSIGALFLFDDSPVGLFVDLGVEGVFFWAETVMNVERSGHVRSLLATIGLAY